MIRSTIPPTPPQNASPQISLLIIIPQLLLIPLSLLLLPARRPIAQIIVRASDAISLRAVHVRFRAAGLRLLVVGRARGAVVGPFVCACGVVFGGRGAPVGVVVVLRGSGSSGAGVVGVGRLRLLLGLWSAFLALGVGFFRPYLEQLVIVRYDVFEIRIVSCAYLLPLLVLAVLRWLRRLLTGSLLLLLFFPLLCSFLLGTCRYLHLRVHHLYLCQVRVHEVAQQYLRVQRSFRVC
jgi:hypothetical protein